MESNISRQAAKFAKTNLNVFGGFATLREMFLDFSVKIKGSSNNYVLGLEKCSLQIVYDP